jgi:hypothetical protein
MEKSGGIASETVQCILRGPIEQNSFNLTSNNSEILIIQHMRKIVLRPEMFLFTRKKASSMKQADLRNMFKTVSNSVCTSTIVVSPDFLSPTPSTSSNLKTRKCRRDTNGPEPAGDGDMQMEYSCDWLYSPKYRSSNKKCKNVGQCGYHLKKSGVFDNLVPVQFHVSRINRILLYIMYKGQLT